MRILFALSMSALALLSMTALAADPDKTHTGKLETSNYTIRYRPGSRAAASAGKWASLAERLHERIATQLDFRPEQRFSIFLYDSVAELQTINGNAGGGFSVPLNAHIPHDNEQTAYHELVHLFTERFPKAGDEHRNRCWPDGIANACLTYVHDVHVHAVARYYLDAKKLPKLAEMMGAPNFYTWVEKHPGINAYDVAASFFRFLLDTEDIAKIRKYYAGMAPKDAFGKTQKDLEKAWLAVVASHPMTEEVETLLRRRHGEKAEFTHFESDPEKRLPADVRGEAKQWKSLMGGPYHPDVEDVWKPSDAKIAGDDAQGGRWVVCELGKRKLKDCVIQARFRVTRFCGAVQIRLGDGCQGMFVQNGAFIYRGETSAAQNGEFKFASTGEVHVTLVRRGANATLYIDGIEAVTAKCDKAPARVGVGFSGGGVDITDVKVRALK
jgi:hypothetical protein